MTRRAPYTEADVKRAIAALRSSGQTVTGFEKTREGFRLLTTDAAQQQPLSALERWEQENGKRVA